MSLVGCRETQGRVSTERVKCTLRHSSSICEIAFGGLRPSIHHCGVGHVFSSLVNCHCHLCVIVVVIVIFVSLLSSSSLFRHRNYLSLSFSCFVECCHHRRYCNRSRY